MENNYFFIDGSSFLSDVERLRKKFKIKESKKLNLDHYVEKLISSKLLSSLHQRAFKRFVFYYALNDERVSKLINFPKFKETHYSFDISFKPCGAKIKKGRAIDNWVLKTNPPNHVLKHLHRTEKGVDTQICCDALLLASVADIDRLFLYTNDADFIPLCQTIKIFGANISLFRLFKKNTNIDLANECDTFNYISKDEELLSLFA